MLGQATLSIKTRSMIDLATLTALLKPVELKLHVKGALANGTSMDEIEEILPPACLRTER